QVVIVSRNMDQPFALSDVAAECIASVFLTIEHPNVSSITAHARDLHSWRVIRNADDSTNLCLARGQRDRLSMVAGGYSDYSAPFFVFIERKNLVCRSSRLECPGALQVFAFEENVAASCLVE